MSATFDILLVEDDHDLREAMADALQRGGYAVMTAPNGLEALEWLRGAAGLPALVLLDLMMPVMDGWQFREEQLKDARLAAIPVATLSARRDLAADPSMEHLQKPIRTRFLLEAVARYCRPAMGPA